MDTRLVIGVSSDEVAGEIRAALVRVGGFGLDCVVDCLASMTVPMGQAGQMAADSTASGTVVSESIVRVAGFRVAQQFFDVARALTERAATVLDQILLIGFKGHPDSAGESHAALVAARLAELSGTTTVSDFSVRDRAAGGRGGPLAPLVDWVLANDPRNSRLMVHVDGVTSLTFVPAAA